MTEQDKSPQLNPNLASLEELQSLSGVGPNLAERIVQGRPYESPDDLLQIAGVGKGSLDRWVDRLTFDAAEEEQPSATASGEDVQDPKAKSSKPKPPARKTKQREKSGESTLVWVAIAVVLSVFLSVSLTLGVLLSINGTLNIGRHSSVRALNSELDTVAADLADLRSQVEGIDQRLDALEGLSSRMNEVEGQVSELEGQMDEAITNVEMMRERFAAIESITESLNTRVNRFDQFLDGLRDLLVDEENDSTLELQDQEATPSQ